MMVETMLESSQDFGGVSAGAMSSGGGVGGVGGALPQWKRELLQRRAQRARPPPPAPAPPPPPPAPDGDGDVDEELRYGPGIVKRLKSRYLSLALRDAPRRRASVLRRAASLEHLLDGPAGAPSAPSAADPRPAPHPAPPPPAPRRDFVKRARSVDALSRLEPRAPPSPPPPPAAPRPPVGRAARPPRRPAPLLREAERPPPDLVRTTLRKFEPTPLRRTHPIALPPPAPSTPPPPPPLPSSTPEPSPRTPSPAAPTIAVDTDEPEGTTPRVVARAALDGIARAGSSTRYSFEGGRRGAHLPPLAAANPVLLRRVGVIRPMPSPALGRATSTPLRPPLEAKLVDEPEETPSPPRSATPPPADAESPRAPDKSPPSAVVEPIPRTPPLESPPPPPILISAEEPPVKPALRPRPDTAPKPKPLVNGFTESPEPRVEVKLVPAEATIGSRLGSATVDRPWGGSLGSPRARRGVAPPAATSVVFNFSNRKEVPDYIENDGLILRASRRDRIKPGEPGVVVLRPGAGADADADSDEADAEAEADAGPPSPCRLKFVNDNVLINGRSSLAARDPSRISRLKLQFDDSLTRTFEYPSETSLCEDDDVTNTAAPSPTPLAAPTHAALGSNTHIASAALSRYTPSKTCADAFQLGVAPAPASASASAPAPLVNSSASAPIDSEGTMNGEGGSSIGSPDGGGGGDARPCGAEAGSWSEARARAHAHATDLLF